MIERWSAVLAIGAACAIGACRKESKPEPKKEPVATTAPAPSQRPQRRPAVNLENIPTEEDFELEAGRDITSKNLEEGVDRLEKGLEGR